MSEFCLTGELTVNTVSRTRDVLREMLAGGQPVTLDLSGVTELDTAGTQQLLAVRRAAERLGVPLTFGNTSPAVAETLAIVRLDLGV